MGGGGREAGSAQGDAIRDIVGEAQLSIDGGTTALFISGGFGAFQSMKQGPARSVGTIGNISTLTNVLNFTASNSVPTAGDTHPVNIALPMILYLGERVC